MSEPSDRVSSRDAELWRRLRDSHRHERAPSAVRERSLVAARSALAAVAAGTTVASAAPSASAAGSSAVGSTASGNAASSAAGVFGKLGSLGSLGSATAAKWVVGVLAVGLGGHWALQEVEPSPSSRDRSGQVQAGIGMRAVGEDPAVFLEPGPNEPPPAHPVTPSAEPGLEQNPERKPEPSSERKLEAKPAPKPERASSTPSSGARARQPEPSALKSQLTAELALIRQARLELKRGDFAAASSTLALHRERHPEGALSPEVGQLELRAKTGLAARAGSE